MRMQSKPAIPARFFPYVLMVLCSVGNARAQESSAIPIPRQIAEVACGECQFGMQGTGCDLAVRIAGSTFFVDGSGIDDHGDAHAEDGLCNRIRKGFVSGHIANGRFIAEKIRLIDGPKPTPEEPGYAEAFLEIWNTVNERFYRTDFGGVNWKASQQEFLPRAAAAKTRGEFATVINAMLARLHTSHTNYFTPDDVEYYYLADIFSAGPLGWEILPRFSEGQVHYDGIGIFCQKIGDDWFIRGAVDGGPAAQAGLRRGMRIISVDGQPFAPIGSFDGKVGTSVAVEVQLSADPASRKIVAVRPVEIAPQVFLLQAMKDSMRIIESGDKRIAYVRIWSYAGQQFQEALVDAINAEPFSTADGLIIDLRDGWGGADPEYLQLFNRQIPQMASLDRSGGRASFDSHWRKPAALLVNEGTRSGKELIAYGFRKSAIGPVVGTRTAGAVVAGTLIPIGGDGLLYLAVKGIEVDGEVLEGIGVEPDHAVPYELPYSDELDPQIVRAIELLTRD